MTLNASGPISLAGSVTGESIAVELSQSPFSVVSLNDTNVRTLAGVSSGAITMPTNFWGKSNATAFAIYSNTGGTIMNIKYKPSTSKFIAVLRGNSTPVQTSSYLAELNADGTTNWVRNVLLDNAGGLRTVNSVDPSGNIYCYYNSIEFTTRNRPGVAKFDSSGNFVSAVRTTWANASSSVSGNGGSWNNNFVYSIVSDSLNYITKQPDSLSTSVSYCGKTTNPSLSGVANGAVYLFKKYNSNDFYVGWGRFGSPSAQISSGFALVQESTFSVTQSRIFDAGPSGFDNSAVGLAQNSANGDIYVSNSSKIANPIGRQTVLAKLDQNLSYVWGNYYPLAINTGNTPFNLFYNSNDGYLYGFQNSGSLSTDYTTLAKIDPSNGDIISLTKITTFVSGVQSSPAVFNFVETSLTNNNEFVIRTSNLFIVTSNLGIFNGTITNPQTTTVTYVGSSMTIPSRTSYTVTWYANGSDSTAPFGYSRGNTSITSNTPTSGIFIKSSI
jgi:hypothetical protein